MKDALIARKIHFSCGHQYANKNWSEEKNKEVFDLCYSPHGHGHNYTLEVFFKGAISSETGMVMDLRIVDSLLSTVVSPLDHQFLNTDVPFFRNHVPTTENIALFCFQHLKENLKNQDIDIQIYKVKLSEGEDLWAEYYG